MDWTAAIDKNRDALKRIVAMLVAMAEVGLGGRFTLGAGGKLTFLPQGDATASGLALAEKRKLSRSLTLPRQLHRFVLRLLRPAEAAARRLIIVAARGLTLPPPMRRTDAARKTGRAGVPPRTLELRIRPLPLLDRLSPWSVRARPVASGIPRISVPGYSQPFTVRLPSADDPVDATRLALRLSALASALDDLPGQARRFARWRARAMPRQSPPPPCGEGIAYAPSTTLRVVPLPRFAGEEPGSRPAAPLILPRLRGRGTTRSVVEEARLLSGPRRVSSAIVPARSRRLWPLRPGRPPGWRRKPTHEVHEVLDVVHGLAHWVLTSPDTS